MTTFYEATGISEAVYRHALEKLAEQRRLLALETKPMTPAEKVLALMALNAFQKKPRPK